MSQRSKLLDDYVLFTRTTAIYPTVQEDPKEIESMYLGLGLANEAGEVAGLCKKSHRDDHVPDLKMKMTKEIGDCMWYIARLCDIYHIDMCEMIQTNMDKLQDRKDRGVLQGSGDNR